MILCSKTLRQDDKIYLKPSAAHVSCSRNQMDDDHLSRLAEEALLREAVLGAQRAEAYGPSGWLKPKLPVTNKRFLQNTILGAMAANRKQDDLAKRKLDDMKKGFLSKEKANKKYKRMYLHASSKAHASTDSDNAEASKSHRSDNNIKQKSPEKNFISLGRNGIEFSNAGKMDPAPIKRDKRPLLKLLPRNIKFSSSVYGKLEVASISTE